MRIAALLFLTAFLPVVAYASIININTANATLLDTLPGIGPSKAAAIIDYRTKNGPFGAIADIQKVTGIGPVTFAKLEALITVGDTSTSPAPQPSPQPVSYKKVQAVEPITSPESNIVTHEEAARAPVSAIELAGTGAALPEALPSPSNPFYSVWALGLVGIMLAAGGAFIFI